MKVLARFNILLKQSRQHLVSFIGGGALLAALLSGSAVGDQHWEALHGEVRRGDVVSLESILDWLDAHYIGEVLEVEVEREKGAVEYEIKMLGPQNQVVEFEFDGHSGQLMSIEGVRINEMRRP
ncbi:PepSY domain-containing protein [Vreelandella zhanjiangensis]|uniref:PepSY domain-containing protein n=1 Tax=Vreelandella zhanjiangensis TaxID=1121960 RepID=UPI00402AC1A9